MKKTYIQPAIIQVALTSMPLMDIVSAENAGGNKGTFNGGQLSRQSRWNDDED